MRHAGSAALDELEPLLAAVRKESALKEKKRGAFYRASRAFLHFHEDPAGLFADMRGADDFDRFRVSSAAERRAFLAELRRRLAQC
jgi:hypothetical protein